MRSQSESFPFTRTQLSALPLGQDSDVEWRADELQNFPEGCEVDHVECRFEVNEDDIKAVRELPRYNITLAGLCETRWPGSGGLIAGDYYTHARLQVAHQLQPGELCLLSARFHHGHEKMPTDVAEDTVKDDYYNQPQQVLGQIPPPTT